MKHLISEPCLIAIAIALVVTALFVPAITLAQTSPQSFPCGACVVCHENNNMGILRLADGTQLPLSHSTQLCGQCHQKRYNAWIEGTHGIPAWKEGIPGFPGADKANCGDCHDPHHPRIALLNITELHPAPAPSPSPPPVALLVVLSISFLLLIIGVSVATMTKGKQK